MNKFILLFVFAVTVSCSTKKISWVAIGDSITYLNEHTDRTNSRITKGYMTLVSEEIKGLSYTNQGYSGWTSKNIADSLEVLKLGKADIYTIFLGTNDWWQGRQIGEFLDYKNNSGNNTLFGSFRLIIDKLRSLNKKAKIILITPLQRVDFVQVSNPKNNAWGSYRDKNGQYLEDFSKAIQKIGEYEKFDVIDLYHDQELKIDELVKFKRLKDPNTSEYKNFPYPLFIDVTYNPDADEYPYPVEAIGLTYDGLHPSDKGYEIIAERLISIMRKIRQ